ncbi:uncharacterized protein LOC105445044 [Strongylocentrotus purpuratus]|uniref:Transposase n=1 Tax=Strongylocentrotus purpuratus TaxID=7668 RepID=A0A7M7N9U5_STRPU|nr:uncharacterized protein LOC105445044 [Strongylocentrotus purpuratus]
MWLHILGRPDPNNDSNFLEPSRGHRVCSFHFIDGEPTEAHPFPSVGKATCNTSPTRKRKLEEEEDHCTGNQKSNHVPKFSTASKFVIYMLVSLIKSFKSQNKELNNEVKDLQTEILDLKKRITNYSEIKCANILKSDNDALFFTGIHSICLFHTLHKFISPFVHRRWRGLKVVSTKVKRFLVYNKKPGPIRKLHSVDEFLLVLIRLRLGLSLNDLAKRFGISIALTSRIFNCWLSAMNQVLGKFIYWAPKEQIAATKPSRFKHLPDIRCIIDCSEIFIQTPKDPFLQSVTWSDYKHHNTAKFLIAVAPNSCITYISPMYGGRASDKGLTLDCGFLDKLDPYDMLQADKGFIIHDECAARFVTLQVPPGKRGETQMSSAAVNKTKKVANLRILVEQVIRRLKIFNILKNEVPVSLIPSLDKIVRVCAALCNLRKPIYST